MSWFPRLIGAATAVYSAVALVKPAVLSKPCKLTDDSGHPEAATALTRSLVARDLVTSIAVAAAPTATSLRIALGLRVVADLSDAVVLGRFAPDADTRKKVVGVAAGWAALTALSALTIRD